MFWPVVWEGQETPGHCVKLAGCAFLCLFTDDFLWTGGSSEVSVLLADIETEKSYHKE